MEPVAIACCNCSPNYHISNYSPIGLHCATIVTDGTVVTVVTIVAGGTVVTEVTIETVVTDVTIVTDGAVASY